MAKKTARTGAKTRKKPTKAVKARKATRAKKARKASRAPARPARKAPVAKAAARPAAKPKAKPAPAKAAQPPGLAPQMPWITPYLTVKDVAGALAYYATAFGFKERFRMPGPGGVIMHAEMQHNAGVIMLGPEDPERGSRAPSTVGGTPAGMYVYVADVDAVFAAATAAGGRGDMPPTDMFWGDRCARIVDPEGHSWMIATFKKMVTPAELAAAMAPPA